MLLKAIIDVCAPLALIALGVAVVGLLAEGTNPLNLLQDLLEGGLGRMSRPANMKEAVAELMEKSPYRKEEGRDFSYQAADC